MHKTALMNYAYRITLAGIFSFSLNACSGGESLPPEKFIDSIAVVKHKREMYIYNSGKVLKIYKIALGLQPVGAKHYKGDMRTPEGLYTINGKNPNSVCHKNVGISYPNNKDRALAAKMGKETGGDIKIHGLPNGQGYIGAAHRNTDWTYGCIAVTDEEMDEIYDHVKPGTPINILP